MHNISLLYFEGIRKFWTTSFEGFAGDAEGNDFAAKLLKSVFTACPLQSA